MSAAEVGSNPEWRLLELVSIADPGSAAFGEAVEVAASVVDPDELLAQAARHALLPALADFLAEAGLLSLMPHQTQKAVLGALHWNRLKTTAFCAEAIRVTDGLAARGITVATTKGVASHALLYDDRGTRHFGDIDLMVLPEQRHEVAAALTELGYAGGKSFDNRTGELVDLPRSVTAMYRLYPDHLPHFLRLAPESAVPYHMVDIAFSLTWYGTAWQVPMDDALATIQRNPVGFGEPGATVPALTTPYSFLFVVLHLFREGWFARVINEKDARLSQFADVWRFWNRLARAQAAEIIAIMASSGIAPAVAWVCHHVDQLYGSSMVSELELGAYCDPQWLCSASSPDGSLQSWHGQFRRRLRERGAPKLVPAHEAPFAVEAQVQRR
ncbi:nucleotidyltransferase family protein [Dactylosporangium sp. NPDC051484]|uniref:nucleotidyltransferase family protein n=1 Tax=Dactylosporangium sp. NPDC051484 TaxID=3154942 RepID=UPI00344BA7E9